MGVKVWQDHRIHNKSLRCNEEKNAAFFEGKDSSSFLQVYTVEIVAHFMRRGPSIFSSFPPFLCPRYNLTVTWERANDGEHNDCRKKEKEGEGANVNNKKMMRKMQIDRHRSCLLSPSFASLLPGRRRGQNTKHGFFRCSFVFASLRGVCCKYYASTLLLLLMLLSPASPSLLLNIAIILESFSPVVPALQVQGSPLSPPFSHNQGVLGEAP